MSEGTNDSLTQQTAEPEDGQIYIHIVGAVKKPGVYTFQKKPRVIEVVEKAGGFTKDAVTAEINQAELVEDGTQLAIASQKDFKEKDGQQAEQTETGKVNLNTAAKEQLMTLTGIGEAKAIAIIAYLGFNLVKNAFFDPRYIHQIFQFLKFPLFFPICV